jgi:hypothetical protein
VSSLRLSLWCAVCEVCYQLPVSWPLDRDLREATDEYAMFILPCRHTPDPERTSATWV